ncbi:tyrosine protein phosphatase [candidate division KSB1 bacterium]|nr:tyrosine protein phosphatase [candidate division KSB1 bacterium]
MKYIDIHSHVLPGIDDGAENWDVSLEMLRQAEQDGIEEVICTPHILSQSDFDREEEILSLLGELKTRARETGITIRMYPGSELYIQPHFQLEKKIATLAQNGRYFLIEFSMSMIPDFVAKKFFELILDDKTPIIAHPERNASVLSQPDKALSLVQRGALLQINAGSLLGRFGKNVKDVAHKLLDANIVHFIASDAHDAKSRPLKLSAAFHYVQENWGPEKARLLFYDNPKKMLSAQDIDMGPILPLEYRKKFSFKNTLSIFKKQ